MAVLLKTTVSIITSLYFFYAARKPYFGSTIMSEDRLNGLVSFNIRIVQVEKVLSTFLPRRVNYYYKNNSF